MFRLRTFQPPNVAAEAVKKAEEQRLAKEAEEAAKNVEEPVKQTTKKNKKK